MPHLHFQQTMWLTEGISPRERPAASGLHGPVQANTWCDEDDWQHLLPLVWHARRKDYWSPVRDVVRQLKSQPERSDGQSFRLEVGSYSALMHMLLYAGDGRHPLQPLEELTYDDPDHVLYGGFTPGFKRCFRDMLTPMHAWWHQARGMSNVFAGMGPEDLESEFCQMPEQDWQQPRRPNLSWDELHLSLHCGAPIGFQYGNSHDSEVSVREHEPTVITVATPNYLSWMRALRTMEIERPTIAKVMLEDVDEFLEGPVLGFWLLQQFDEPKNGWRNNARFITDAQVPAVLSLVRDWN